MISLGCEFNFNSTYFLCGEVDLDVAKLEVLESGEDHVLKLDVRAGDGLVNLGRHRQRIWHDSTCRPAQLQSVSSEQPSVFWTVKLLNLVGPDSSFSSL